MKNFIIILLAFLIGCTVLPPIQTAKKFNIPEETSKKILLEYDYAYWKVLNEYQQFQLIIQMVNISDGILNFQIAYPDSAYIELVMMDTMGKIKVCADESGWNYYVAYENDLQIGTVLLQCMIQENMMRY